jgi:hypothetical protein
MARLKFLIFIIFFSCLESKDSHLIVQKKDRINNITVKYRILDRGSVKYNNSYIFFNICDLENKSKKINDLYDLYPPFILYKYENDEKFYIIKDTDTLIFKLNYLE